MTPYLRGNVVVGARNAPRQTVLADPEPQLGEVTGLLREQGMVCRTVSASTSAADASSGAMKKLTMMLTKA